MRRLVPLHEEDLAMACITAQGTLTASGQQLLAAVQLPSTPEQVAAGTGLPLYRVRSGLRELEAAGLVTEESGRFQQPGEATATAG